MGKTAMKILSMKDEEFYEGMGRYFVTLAKDAGYERTILQLGRGLRDFFLNLDNLHDYLKYTFPKMKAPSFFVDSETDSQLMLQYRTRRRGFHYYVQGQVKEIGKVLFLNAGDVTNKLEAKLKNFWELMKPLVDFKYEVIETRMNSMFELATQEEIDKLRSATGSTSDGGEKSEESLELEDLDDIDKTLHIKGQMVFIKEWSQMLFLACPIMKGLNNLIWSGLFINDLSMHDYSRDIMLANAQTEMEANLAKMELAKKDSITKNNNEKAR